MSNMNMKSVEEMRNKIKPVNLNEPYVFVSYRKLDSEIVYPIIIELQNRGVNLWIDLRGLEESGGLVWSEEAFSALRSSRCKKLLFFMTVNSFMSIPVLSELQFTKNKKFTLQHKIDSRDFFILPVSLDSKMKSMGDVLIACENHEKYHSCIDDYEKKYFGSKIFKESLNPENFNDIDDGFEYSGLISYVFQTVFEEKYERTVVSDISSILSNIPKEAINTNNADFKNANNVNSKDKENKQSSFDSQKHDDNTNINDAAKSNIQNNNSDDNIYEVSSKDYNARYKIVGDSIIILKGSKINYSEEYSPKKIYQNLVDNHKINEDGILLDDVEPLPRSTAGRLIKGMSTSGADLMDEKRKIK